MKAEIVSVPCCEVKTKTLSSLALGIIGLAMQFATEAEFSETISADIPSKSAAKPVTARCGGR